MARPITKKSLRIQPGYAEVHNNLAMILLNEGRIAEAEAGFREALKYKPDLAEAHNNLGVALVSREKIGGSRRPFCQGAGVETRTC